MFKIVYIIQKGHKRDKSTKFVKFISDWKFALSNQKLGDTDLTIVIFEELPICKKLHEEIQILNLEHINMKMAKNDKIMSWGDFRTLFSWLK